MHDLIKYLTEWELELAEGICSNLHPDALFHHDDWGGLDSTFMSPAMFDEFLLEPYKEFTDIITVMALSWLSIILTVTQQHWFLL